jgi:hypothetical protein
MSAPNGTALAASANLTETSAEAADSSERWWNAEDTAPMDAVDRPNSQVRAVTSAPVAMASVAALAPTPVAPASARRFWQRGSEAARLEAELAEAARLVPIQSDPLLAERMSPRERKAQARSAQKVRTAQREAWEAERLAQVRRGTRAQKLVTELENQKAADDRWHRRAESERQRLTSPAVRMGRLARSIRQRRLVLLLVATVGVLWGAANVHDIVTTHFKLDNTMALYYLSYGLEPLLTVPLIQMMRDRANMAEWGRALTWRRNWPVYLVEAGLLLTATAISTIPRMAEGWSALLYVVPPVMIAVSMILLPNGAHHLGEILIEARDDAAEQAALDDGDSPLAKFVTRFTAVCDANAQGEIGGERDELGVPSARQIAIHQACNKGTAGTIRKVMAAARA